MSNEDRQALADARATADAALVVAQVAAGMVVPGVTGMVPWAPPRPTPATCNRCGR